MALLNLVKGISRPVSTVKYALPVTASLPLRVQGHIR